MSEPARTGFRLGCYGWIMLSLGLIAALAGGIWLWLSSHGDLDELQTELRAKGHPATWEDLGYRTSTPDRVADWKRLLTLAAALKTYQDKDSDWMPRPGEPVPEAARAFFASSVTDAANIRTLLERLGPEPIFTRTRYGPTDSFDDLGPPRNLARWQKQRMACVDAADLFSELVVSSQGLIRREIPSLIHSLVSYSITSLWISSATCRLHDLPTADRRRLAELCRKLERWLTQQAAAAVQAEVISMIGFAKSAKISAVSDAYDLTSQIFGNARLGKISSVFAMRIARADAILALSDYAVLAAASPSMADRLAGARRLADTTGLPVWSPRRICWQALVSGSLMVVESECRLRGNLLLLAAELEGSPWPIDPLDPAGKPYRRLERDGRLIGAYSVGKNGLDDFGAGDDRCLDLYGRCRLPRP